MKKSIKEAYDPEIFRRQGHAFVDFLADALQKSHMEEEKVLNWQEPDEQYAFWESDWKKADKINALELFKQIYSRCVQVHKPKYMGHQMSPPAPLSALAGFLSDFMNNGMGVYEVGAPATALERLVIKIAGRQLGFSAEADGVITSGGTLANLTALLAVRSIKASEQVWTQGGKRQYALMVSEEAHYCVDRAARIMGWGSEGIIKVAVNEYFQMRTECLPELYEKAKAQGKEVLAIIGSAGTTSTGSFDNLTAIANFCERHKLWFHVDGAHGGALSFSKKYRGLLRGLERADSVVMDFHKMLATPAITSALIFKDGRHSFQTFTQNARYLFEQSADREWYNLAKRTFECTKLMLSVRAYSVLRFHGLTFLDDHVTSVIDLSARFANMIKAFPFMELCVRPECNIVCFRYRPLELKEKALDLLNEAIRKKILEEGRFYIVKTNLLKKTWLRTTLTNPFTKEKDLLELLETISTLGESLLLENEKIAQWR